MPEVALTETPPAPATAAPTTTPTVEPAAACVSPRRRLFNVDEYYRMAEAGILTRDEHVELIDGEILKMSPIGIRHSACVDDLCSVFARRLEGRSIVRGQNPLRLSDRSEPLPDVTLLRPRNDKYRTGHPGPADVFFLIEVMDSSVDYDRGLKLLRYAREGVPEVWLVDLGDEQIEVYRRPLEGVYTEVQTRPRGQAVSPAEFPDVVLNVDDILG